MEKITIPKKEFEYSSDPDIRELEEKALKIDEKETRNLNYWFNCDFNKRTGDMAWWCYAGNLKQIIKKGEQDGESTSIKK